MCGRGKGRGEGRIYDFCCEVGYVLVRVYYFVVGDGGWVGGYFCVLVVLVWGVLV